MTIPKGLQCHAFAHEGRSLWVVSFALPGDARDDLASLTPALREVATMVVQGIDTATIAARRRTSVRTVAKQLEQVFARLGVGSRGELVARYAESVSAEAAPMVRARHATPGPGP